MLYTLSLSIYVIVSHRGRNVHQCELGSWFLVWLSVMFSVSGKDYGPETKSRELTFALNDQLYHCHTAGHFV